MIKRVRSSFNDNRSGKRDARKKEKTIEILLIKMDVLKVQIEI